MHSSLLHPPSHFLPHYCHNRLTILFTILRKTHNIVTDLWQNFPPYCHLPQDYIYMLTVCGHNIVKVPPYCDHLWLKYMLTVLWNLTIWWTILSQYVENFCHNTVTILLVLHNMMNNIVNILWQYYGGKCEDWWCMQ